MASLYTRLKTFFKNADKFSGINELFQLESLEARPIDQIQKCIMTHFDLSSELAEKISYFSGALEVETNLTKQISYALIFKDLVSIGPAHISLLFLQQKLHFHNSEILRLFYSYTMKIAFNHGIYVECLAIFNRQSIPPTIIKAYKALNLLNQIFNMIELIVNLQHSKIYTRVCMCLISDAVLYFCYVKGTLIGEAEGSEQELLSLLEEFTQASVSFRQLLFEFRIQNKFYRLEEQREITNLRRKLRKSLLIERELVAETDRVANKENEQEFSFGIRSSRCIDKNS